ncbi:hypothetical protein [Polyangium mundeleinium]|uniref:Carboxypeptidase regulatory-like domain-containing protein n=1 Tax=Polyangium mundeleinium TaxID=2995306 RepID=A0ABT5F1L7_9BACT|nr:hypothetical protein [Polyangium mundeleinium]MDC0747977.1 hypothetical protein [Polyangium mundeleinium]
MRSFLGATSICLLGALGCSGGGETPNPPFFDVTGTIVDLHLTEGGDATNVRDPGQFEIAALVPGEDGAPRELVAEVAEDGTFRIRDLPEGPYDLRFTELFGTGTRPPRFIMGAPRTIDLGRVFVGRPDAEPIATGSTTELELTLDGLSAWGEGSSIEVFSLGAGTIGTLPPANGMQPAMGATQVTDFRVATSELVVPNLVAGDAGDQVYFTQMVGTAGPGAPYRSVRKAFGPTSFTLADGATTPVEGTFVNATPKKLAVSFDDAAFQALAASVHPEATIAGKDVRIGVEPGGADRTSVSPTPDLLLFSGLPAAQPPAEFVYGTPFPDGWAEVAAVQVSYAVTHVMPTGIPKTTAVAIGRSGPVSSFSGAVAPPLGPPLDIRVNDQPAYGELLGIGKTPTVTWSAPSLGKAAAYVITLRRLDPGGQLTRTMASFSTNEPVLRIPDGLLDVGYYYYLRIGVRDEFDSTAPLQVQSSRAYAEAITGVLSP